MWRMAFSLSAPSSLLRFVAARNAARACRYSRSMSERSRRASPSVRSFEIERMNSSNCRGVDCTLIGCTGALAGDEPGAAVGGTVDSAERTWFTCFLAVSLTKQM